MRFITKLKFLFDEIFFRLLNSRFEPVANEMPVLHNVPRSIKI